MSCLPHSVYFCSLGPARDTWRDALASGPFFCCPAGRGRGSAEAPPTRSQAVPALPHGEFSPCTVHAACAEPRAAPASHLRKLVTPPLRPPTTVYGYATGLWISVPARTMKCTSSSNPRQGRLTGGAAGQHQPPDTVMEASHRRHKHHTGSLPQPCFPTADRCPE